MTFRELKQFSEIMRTLGYQKPVGIDSFDSPNFGLMADLLHWLTALYDPDIVILPDLSSEHTRVEFVKSVVQQMAIRSGVRMNPRKLYASDRFAVRELLKIAAPVYRGIVSCEDASLNGDAKDVKVKPPSVQRISQLSASVPKHSVELYDALEKELMVREARNKILSTMPPLDEVEKNVIAAVDAATTRLDMLTKELEKLNSDEDTLHSKIQQKKHELDRQMKRELSVKTIRPAFMDEYEALEQDLRELFAVHFQHYRNVDYFENELQKMAEKRRRRIEQAQRKINKAKERASKTLVQSIGKSVGPTPEFGEEIGFNVGDVDDDNGSENSF